jgi:hypothetical protein
MDTVAKENWHRKAKEEIKEIVDNGLKGAMKSEMERLSKGGTDFSLFNLMLERVDFKNCHTPMDAMRGMYEALWPYYSKVIKENAFFREIVQENVDAMRLPLGDLEKLKEIFVTDVSPNTMATKILEQIREAAKKRSKLNLY